MSKKFIIILLGLLISNAGFSVQKVDFIFFGTNLSVSFSEDQLFKLSNSSDLYNAWEQIHATSKKTLYDCQRMKESRHFNDWAYYLMLQSFANAALGENTNEATLFWAALWDMSGYRGCMATDSLGKLYFLFASDDIIYDYPTFNYGGGKYYLTIDSCHSSLMFIDNINTNSQNKLSLSIEGTPLLSYWPAEKRRISSRKGLELYVQVNKNLIDFYNAYPYSITNWTNRANIKMDEKVLEQLYPQIEKQIIGLSKLEALELLLNLVQTGFDYGYDENVWGKDRPFFSEETLYYPYSDTEDRVILLTRLVRDFLHLHVIIMYFPKHGHMAMAVCLEDEIDDLPKERRGYDIIYNNEEYIICDPTYINAPVGSVIPEYQDIDPEIIFVK